MAEMIPCCGRKFTATTLAQVAGVSVATILQRYNKGWRDEKLLLKPYAVLKEKQPSCVNCTEDELFELYKDFAGYEEELQMLADFMGREADDKEVTIMLASLRARYWRGR